jgi:hypothetical protein
MNPNPFEPLLPPDLEDRLLSYQIQHGLKDQAATIFAVLMEFFGLDEMGIPFKVDPSLQDRVTFLEQQLAIFTRELITLRQSVPKNQDQLRGQLAAVRLSHSGLLQNLRERVELLEQRVEGDASRIPPPPPHPSEFQ